MAVRCADGCRDMRDMNIITSLNLSPPVASFDEYQRQQNPAEPSEPSRTEQNPRESYQKLVNLSTSFRV